MRPYRGRHEARPQWQTDRDRIRQETAERVRRAPITGRHEAA